MRDNRHPPPPPPPPPLVLVLHEQHATRPVETQMPVPSLPALGRHVCGLACPPFLTGMFRWAGRSFAMKGSAPEVAHAATDVTPGTVEDDGVAGVLDALLPALEGDLAGVITASARSAPARL